MAARIARCGKFRDQPKQLCVAGGGGSLERDGLQPQPDNSREKYREKSIFFGENALSLTESANTRGLLAHRALQK
jgi:hypothetical protein